MKMVGKAILTLAAVAALSVPAMAAGTPKLQVKNSGGNTTFVVNDDGTIGAGVSSTFYPFQMTSDNAGSVPAGVGAFMFTGSTNKERFEVQSWGAVYGQGPVFQGKGGGGTASAPTLTLANHNLFMLGGSGYDGTKIVTANRALIKIIAPADWSTTSNPTKITFEATPVNSLTRPEYLAIDGTGVAVENAPLKLSTPGTAPACDSTRRGSFWVNQGASVDSVQVCVQTSAGVYGWKTVTLQ